MSRKLKKKRDTRAHKTSGEAPFAGLSPLLPVGAVLSILIATVCCLEWLRSQVMSAPEYNAEPKIKLEFMRGSEWVLQEGWLPRIQASLKPPKDCRLTSDELLREVAKEISASGWVRSVEQVNRGMDGTIRVLCDYRRPIAMVLTNRGKYIPIDKDGVRLPEEYEKVESDSGWMRILGVQSEPPAVGRAYGEQRDDADAVAAVRLAFVLFSQAEIADKISGIDVSNFNGRENKFKTHITLYPRDGRPGIGWGSAIGREVEEPGLVDKLRNLALYLKSDSPQAYADLSVYRNGVLSTVRP